MTVKRSKRFMNVSKKIERKRYSTPEAFKFLTENSAKKDSIDAVFVLGIDPKKSDQVVKGVVDDLPHGLGKDVSIAIFSKTNIEELRKLDVKYVGFEDLIADIKNGTVTADVFLATRDLMPELAKLGIARILKGKMPNPKTGTVVEEKALAKAVEKQRKGQLVLRSQGHLIQASIGRASFPVESLNENFAVLKQSILNLKPASVKLHGYIKKVFVSATMSPSLEIDIK